MTGVREDVGLGGAEVTPVIGKIMKSY